MTTSSVTDAPPFMARDGYQITRRTGRYSIFPRTMISGFLGHLGRADGLVEIWNGMPFLSPIWARCPRVVFLHHVHAEMWKMVLPRGLAELGYGFEHRVAPPFYRRSRIITLSAVVTGRDRRTAPAPGRQHLGLPTGGRVRLQPRIAPLDDPADRRRRTTGAGQAVRTADRCGRAAQAEPPGPAAGHCRRGLRAAGARGADPPGGRRGVDQPPGIRRRQRVDRALSVVVAGGVEFPPRRLGHDCHRGRRLRDPGGGIEDQRAHGRCPSTANRGSSSTMSTAW